MTRTRIVPCLWFDDQAEEAAAFCVATVPDAHAGAGARYPPSGPNPSGRPPGSVMTVDESASTERDGTHMLLRNRGHPPGLAALIAPVVAASMRRAMRADLARLKAVLERPSSVRRIRPPPEVATARAAVARVALADGDGNEIPVGPPA